MDKPEHLALPPDDHEQQAAFCTWVRPTRELRRIDRILSQWTDGELAHLHGTEARGITRLREIRAALVPTLADAQLETRRIDTDRVCLVMHQGAFRPVHSSCPVDLEG